jgi:nitrous oxidase accessory protein NosD
LANDLYVGGGGTPNYTTIQAAVTAAVSGDTIHVAAGTYAEQVAIAKALTLQGAGATTIIKPTSLTTYVTTPSVAGSTKCTGAVVVNNAGGSVTIKDLKVDASSLNTDRTLWFSPTVALMKFAGVFYYNTSGTIDNVVSTNTNHITIATTGASTWGRQVQSFKIDADAATTVSVEIKNCTASTFLGEAISVGWNTPTHITVNIHNNTIAGDGSLTTRRQNGIYVYYATVTAVSNNTISNVAYRSGMSWATGIVIVSIPSGAIIEHNAITNCDFGITDTFSSGVTIQHNDITGSNHDYGTGVYLDNGGANLTGIIVRANTIGSGFPTGGICLRGWYAGNYTISETITDNVLTGNGTTDGYGIYDWSGGAGAVTSTITGNTITGWDSGFSIEAGAPVSGFTIRNNSISGNTHYGVINNAYGALTATNNWWGAASGPGTVGPGTGDKVSTDVTYNPWYVDAAMTTLSNVAPANVYVSSTYVDGNAGGHAFGYDAFTTIQSGISAVSTGGTVHVAGGTYVEHLTIGKSLALQGNSEPSPIIDGGTTGTAVTISASNVTVIGFTIQNAATGIAATSGTGNAIHFCNILSNSAWGIDNTSGNRLDATDNYWGIDSWPSGGAADPVTGRLADGAGDKVSTNVLFDPWTGMSTSVVTAPDQGQGAVVDNPGAGASLTIDTASGTTDVTIAKYESPPPDTPSFGADATYLDIKLSDPAAVSQLTITFDGMSDETIIYFYRPGTGWVACSNQTYASGTITVTVTNTTTPTLFELTGTIFAGGTAKGNVNGDSVIDVLDARLCLQIATGFLAGTSTQRAAADVDNDGDVDLVDAEILAQYIIGIITALPTGAE